MFNAFFSGAIFMAALTITMMFVRMWQRTHDRLFAFFAGAFAVFAAERVILTAMNLTSESAPYAYLVRLLAFVMIIAAVVDRNRR